MCTTLFMRRNSTHEMRMGRGHVQVCGTTRRLAASMISSNCDVCETLYTSQRSQDVTLHRYDAQRNK